MIKIERFVINIQVVKKLGMNKLKSARYKAQNSEVIYQYDYDENGVLKGCTKLK